ncbi:tannase/feruloyl esterase family alpha/beta hydrolase [Sphingosinicellaceae bacterium]|nr:tannase/feruloyl esterase family alpha/beta hydrolase [Sphingosinicellaceae bacterium]
MKFAAIWLLPLLLGLAPTDSCRDLAKLSRPGLTVTAARDGSSCRVEGVARPRPASAIRFELWLPPKDRWSGRYYQMGNGGFAGHIDRPALVAAAARGDAAAATDTGHEGDGFDAGWAVGRPDLIVDYAWRSIKVTSDAARAIAREYYDRIPTRRYYMGCSFGGRQALVAATRWPNDWDGVIAGAPATRWPVRLRAFGRIQAALRSGRIASKQVEPLIAAARLTCPTAGYCGARAAALACRAGDRRLCLTMYQSRAIATIERAGYPLTAAEAGEWRRWILDPDATAPSQAAFGRQASRLAGYDRDFALGSLRTFAARGGRVISYFGTADPVLPSGRALADAASIGARDDFYRLFMVPGMAHCQGGTSAPAFGQSLAAPAAVDDPEHDIRSALEAWTEQGVAPDRLLVVVNSGRRAVALSPVIFPR